MKKKLFWLIFSFSFLIFSFLFKFINSVSNQITKQQENTIVKEPQKLSCSFSKNEVKELSLYIENDQKVDCLLMGCNLFEFN